MKIAIIGAVGGALGTGWDGAEASIKALGARDAQQGLLVIVGT